MNWRSVGNFVPSLAKFGPWTLNERYTVNRGRVKRVCFTFLPFPSKPLKVSMTCGSPQPPSLLSK